MPVQSFSPTDSQRSSLFWRLAAPSLAVSVALLAVAGLAAVSLFVAQREADRVLNEVVQADTHSGDVESILKAVRLQLMQHATDGVWDFPQWNALRHRFHDIVELAQKFRSRDDDELQDTLQRLDRELGRLVFSPDPQQRRQTADRIINEILEPELLAIAEQDREQARQALLAAQARSRGLTRWTGWMLLLLGVGGAAAGALAGFSIARTFRQKLVELRVPIQSASGSLDAVVGPVQVWGGAEVEDLEQSLNSLAARVSDVVQRLQAAERESLRNDQLAALGQLAAGLAHELRNPLTAIRTLVEIARSGGPAARLDGRDLEVVDEELTRLDTTLQSFLDYARPPKLERRAIDVRDVIQRTVQLVTPRAEQQSVDMFVAAPPNPLRVSADPEQLRQVLLNLLLNALDALGAGGRIDISANFDFEQRQVVLKITDSGPGIPESIRDKLFEPFVSSKSSGTGLGLTICRRIIENHGGTLTAANGLDGGAVFTIHLPAEFPVAPPTTEPANNNTHLQHTTLSVAP